LNETVKNETKIQQIRYNKIKKKNINLKVCFRFLNVFGEFLLYSAQRKISIWNRQFDLSTLENFDILKDQF
jgi:hypothetical protein